MPVMEATRARNAFDLNIESHRFSAAVEAATDAELQQHSLAFMDRADELINAIRDAMQPLQHDTDGETPDPVAALAARAARQQAIRLLRRDMNAIQTAVGRIREVIQPPKSECRPVRIHPVRDKKRRLAAGQAALAKVFAHETKRYEQLRDFVALVDRAQNEPDLLDSPEALRAWNAVVELDDFTLSDQANDPACIAARHLGLYSGACVLVTGGSITVNDEEKPAALMAEWLESDVAEHGFADDQSRALYEASQAGRVPDAR